MKRMKDKSDSKHVERHAKGEDFVGGKRHPFNMDSIDLAAAYRLPGTS